MKMRLVAAFVWLFACTASVALGPQITCSGVQLNSDGSNCNLVPTGACSDGHFYEVDCADDATCTCTVDGQVGIPIIASDQTAGYCATLTVAMMHEIAAQCADPYHTGDNLNIVTSP